MTTRIRVATYNTSLNRDHDGELVRDLEGGKNEQARKIAEVIQRVRPDIIPGWRRGLNGEHRATSPGATIGAHARRIAARLTRAAAHRVIGRLERATGGRPRRDQLEIVSEGGLDRGPGHPGGRHQATETRGFQGEEHIGPHRVGTGGRRRRRRLVGPTDTGREST